MTLNGTTTERHRFGLTSVLAKISFILGAAGLLLIALMAGLYYQSSRDQLTESLRQQAHIVTPMVARQVQGALRFGKPEPAIDVLKSVVAGSEGEAQGLLVLAADGTHFASELVDADTDLLTRLAKEALAGKQTVNAQSGLYIAQPIFLAAGDAPIGAIATGWTTAARRAAADAQMVQKMLILVGACGLIVFAIGRAISRLVTRPLARVNEAVSRVASEDYSGEILDRDRRDEIGAIADSLEHFRKKLATSEALQRNARVRSSALDASTSALILTDTENRITFANAAAIELLRAHESSIRAAHPTFNAENLIGYDATKILPDSATLAAVKSGGHDDRITLEQRLPTGYLHVSINPVFDANGDKIAHVSEWRDRTESQRNAAVLQAIDRNQIRVDLTPEVKIDLANEGFATFFGETPQALRGRSMKGQILLDGVPVCTLLSSGTQVQGMMVMPRPEGDILMEGVVNPILDAAGEMIMFTILANDVTAREKERVAASTARQAMADAQRQVVDALRQALARLSTGDMTARIDTLFPDEYETLRADYNATVDNLLQAIQRVLENADNIRSEVAQITSAAEDMSRRTEQQAATLEETAAALNQLTASVKSAADGAERANEMVSGAKRNAETSGEVVQEAVLAMGEIEESSNKISKITSVIDEIAFQTNLLALNAGVEAARAGEAGRGFAVVASEVRALAQRSSDAAREIAGLISNSSNQVKRGVDLVGQAGNALQGIQASVADIFTFMTDITSSTREQSTGLSEINTAMHQLDQVTQHNAAMFEETSAASQSLSRETEGLVETMGQFRLGATNVISPAQIAPERKERVSANAPAFMSRRSTNGPIASLPPPIATAAVRGGAASAAQRHIEEDWEDF